MSSFDWKSLTVGVTSLIVVAGTALIIMSPVHVVREVGEEAIIQCFGYTSNFPAVCFVIGLVIGLIIGCIFWHLLTKMEGWWYVNY